MKIPWKTTTAVNNEMHKEQNKNFCIIGTRHQQSFLVFCGIAITLALRVNLSVAIVAMTDEMNQNVITSFIWDQSRQSLLLSAFFWGYLINQIPGGQLSKKYGAKYTLLLSIGGSSILTLAIPAATIYFNWIALFILRFLIGCVQGFTFPSIHTFLSKWAPVNERGRLLILMYSGITFGTFVMILSSGQMAAHFGWPSIFYISGGIGVIWSCFWMKFGASTPAQHHRISTEEKLYIQMSLGHTEETHREYVPTPWLKIFTSMPFYALLTAQACQLFGFTMFLTESPTYFHGVFNTPIDDNAIVSSLPYLGRFVMEFTWMGLEYLISKRLTIAWNRKFFNTIGQILPAIGFIILGFIPSNHLELAVLTLVLSTSLNGACGLGLQVNHIDLAPNHAGTLMGICNIFGGIFGILSPIIVGWIVTDVHNQQQWQIIFTISSTLLLIGGITFLVFASTEIQNWNKREKNSN